MTKYKMSKKKDNVELLNVMSLAELQKQADECDAQLKAFDEELAVIDQRKLNIEEAKKYLDWFVKTAKKHLKK